MSSFRILVQANTSLQHVWAAHTLAQKAQCLKLRLPWPGLQKSSSQVQTLPHWSAVWCAAPEMQLQPAVTGCGLPVAEHNVI